MRITNTEIKKGDYLKLQLKEKRRHLAEYILVDGEPKIEKGFVFIPCVGGVLIKRGADIFRLSANVMRDDELQKDSVDIQIIHMQDKGKMSIEKKNRLLRYFDNIKQYKAGGFIGRDGYIYPEHTVVSE